MSAAPQGRRFVGSAAITAVLQVTTMALGGVIAILIFHAFGKGRHTDGLFAAYGVYGIVAILAQTFRTTMVPRLGTGGELWPNLDRLAGASAVIFVAAGIPFLALGDPLSTLLTGSGSGPAHDAARSALAILWPAAGAQLLSAVGAAALAVRGEFALPGFAYAAGSAVAIAVLAALSDGVGTDAVAIGLVAGSLLTLAIVAARLIALGYRPQLRRLLPTALSTRHVAVMVTGSIGSIVAQLVYLVSIGFAARIGKGEVTLYSYAFFAAMILIGATATPAAIVFIAPLSADWDRRPQSLERDLLAIFRTGLTLLAPVVAAAALVGVPVVRLALGSSLSHDDARTIVTTFLALSPIVATTLATIVPMLATFALGRYERIAYAAVGSGVLHVGLTALAVQTDSVQAVGGAAAVSSVAFLAFVLRGVYRRGAGAVGSMLARELGLVVAVAGLAFGPCVALAAVVPNVGLRVALWFAGTAVFAALAHRLLPENWELLQRIVEPARVRLGRGRAPAREPQPDLLGGGAPPPGRVGPRR